MVDELEGDFSSIKHSIDMNKYEYPTVILAMDSLKYAGGGNPYVLLRYDSQTIFQHTRGQVSGPKVADPINENKQVNNQLCFNQK